MVVVGLVRLNEIRTILKQLLTSYNPSQNILAVEDKNLEINTSPPCINVSKRFSVCFEHCVTF